MEKNAESQANPVPINFSAGANLHAFYESLRKSALEMKLSVSSERFSWKRVEEESEHSKYSHTVLHIGKEGFSDDLLKITAYGSGEISVACYELCNGFTHQKAKKLIKSAGRTYLRKLHRKMIPSEDD